MWNHLQSLSIKNKVLLHFCFYCWKDKNDFKHAEVLSTLIKPYLISILDNWDSSLLSSNCAGIGRVIKDDKGRFLSAYGKQLYHRDVAQLEFIAILSLKDILDEWMTEAEDI
ncbi:hypothetical protein M5K25_001887 [Dendrobium thyrsiflorum]|uniref:RNase H type-1 domain-containing protein n=1 Tax=Dendrobium thyrsiflorum TaxID=117978 RepID=A0ABD0VRM6_DENTH